MYDLILRKLRIVRIFRVDVLGIPAFAACSFNSLYEVITRLSWYFLAQLGNLFLLHLQQVVADHHGLFALGLQLADEGLQDGRLAGAGLADQIDELALLDGSALSDNGDFTVEMYTHGDKWVAKLTPKQAKLKKMFSSIYLYFNEKHNVVTKVEMKEANGDTTIITFGNVKLNG